LVWVESPSMFGGGTARKTELFIGQNNFRWLEEMPMKIK
jgi:hypothetical protein